MERFSWNDGVVYLEFFYLSPSPMPLHPQRLHLFLFSHIPMQAFEIFKAMSPAMSLSLVNWMRDEEKPVFKATLSALAQQKKLRPVFLERKPRGEQAQWVSDNLKLRLSEAIGENVLQIWLLKKNQDMLATFLDEIGVPHDGKGAVDGDLPATLDAGKVNAGVKALADKYQPEAAAIYLHLFQLQQPGGWPELSAAMEANPSVKLG
jgi:hypothetical protein